MSVDIVFSMDSTGSMYPCISELRRNVAQTIDNLFLTVPNLRIGLIAHGDYDDSPYTTKVVELTDNKDKLIHFVRTVETTNGYGNGGECYELVMNTAKGFNWAADKRCYVLIGDEPAHRYRSCPHTYAYHKTHKVVLDWRKEAQEIKNNGIIMYTVRCLNRTDSRQFHNDLAAVAGNPLLTLNQFANIEKLVTALVYKQESNDLVRQYGESLEASGLLNRDIASIINTILGTKDLIGGINLAYSDDLIHVHPSRFQVLHVDANTDIKGFVMSTGAKFKIGRGFYELTKKEEVQEKKEVILQNRLGDFFTGAKAREMIGLPYGKRGNVHRSNVPNDYKVFIQSTSSNRKLMAGTMFLYDTDI